MPTCQSEVPYMAEKIKEHLVGGTIKVEIVSEPDGESFGFIVTFPDKRADVAVWVDMDGEGNGPGWLNIQSGTGKRLA